MPPRKRGGRPPSKHESGKTARDAEQKFGKAARAAAERSGKKPKVWRESEQRLPGAAPLESENASERPERAEAVTRTVEATASEIYRAFNDPTRRGWCHEPGFAVRASVAPRSLVIALRDGTTARVSIERKGNVRTLVRVELAASSAPRERDYWKQSLERLGDVLQ